MESTISAFVITVDDKGGRRRQHVQSEASKLGTPWEFVEGVKLAPRESSPHYSPLLNRLLYKRPLTHGEISCYLSHQKAWRRFLDSNADFGLFLEDDFQIVDQDELRQLFSDVRGNTANWDIIKLFDLFDKKTIATMQLGETTLLFKRYPPKGAVGYLVKRDACRKLLCRKRFFRPVDDDISHPWEYPILVWSTTKNVVTEIASSVGGSLLEDQRQHADSDRNSSLSRVFFGRISQLYKSSGAWMYRRIILSNLG